MYSKPKYECYPEAPQGARGHHYSDRSRYAPRDTVGNYYSGDETEAESTYDEQLTDDPDTGTESGDPSNYYVYNSMYNPVFRPNPPELLKYNGYGDQDLASDYTCEFPLPCELLPKGGSTCPTDEDRGDGVTDDDFSKSEYNLKAVVNVEKFNEFIDKVTSLTSFDEFIAAVPLMSSDQATLMVETAYREVEQFKELIQEVYTVRTDNVSEILKKEQINMKQKYERLSDEMIRKAEAGLQVILNAIPDFDYYEYKPNPTGYLREKLLNTLDNKLTDGAAEGTTRSNKKRALAHQVTYLINEAREVECHNATRMQKLHQLMNELACVSDGLAVTNKKIAAYNRQLEAHAQCLRSQIKENEEYATDLIMEAHNKKCAGDRIIHPDDVIKPVLAYYDYC